MSAANSSPFIKSFFAESLREAMARARVELGTDALLLNSREAPPEARHLGMYEVVFATYPEPAAPAIPAAPAPSAPVAAAATALAPARVEALGRRVAKVRESLVHANYTAPAKGVPIDPLVQTLIRAGVERALAREIGEAARRPAARRPAWRLGLPRPASGPDRPSAPINAAEEVAAHFEVAPGLGRVTALVGPPGSGKTTTLVKLAIARGLAQGRAVRLISTDTHRIGGMDQLRTFSRILGTPFQAVESAAALAQAVASAPPAALVLIDTPGYSATTLPDLGGDLAAFLSRRQDIDTHLVLTASTRIEDLYNIAGLYDAFQPAKLLFTRVDETSSLAAVFCVAARRKRPVSFLATGQSVPEDLEAATKERIVGSLVRQLPSAMVVAA